MVDFKEVERYVTEEVNNRVGPGYDFTCSIMELRTAYLDYFDEQPLVDSRITVSGTYNVPGLNRQEFVFTTAMIDDEALLKTTLKHLILSHFPAYIDVYTPDPDRAARIREILQHTSCEFSISYREPCSPLVDFAHDFTAVRHGVNQKARELLLSVLPESERARYEENGTIECDGNKTGMRYRIHAFPQANIELADAHLPEGAKRWACVVSGETIPLEDQLAAQYLMVTCNEEEFLEKAIWWN